MTTVRKCKCAVLLIAAPCVMASGDSKSTMGSCLRRLKDNVFGLVIN